MYCDDPGRMPTCRLMPAGIKSLAEAAHIGWFGSVGVAAYYYALTTLEDREVRGCGCGAGPDGG